VLRSQADLLYRNNPSSFVSSTVRNPWRTEIYVRRQEPNSAAGLVNNGDCNFYNNDRLEQIVLCPTQHYKYSGGHMYDCSSD
jgi:hypothetical protein